VRSGGCASTASGASAPPRKPGFAGSASGNSGIAVSVICAAMSGGVRRHVRKHHIGGSFQDSLDLVRRTLIQKIKTKEFNAGDRRHGKDIDGDDASLACARLHALCRDLTPAPGCRTQIDNARSGFEEMMLVVDLGELECRTRTQPFAPRTRDVGVVKLPLEPKLRRMRAALCGSQLQMQTALRARLRA